MLTVVLYVCEFHATTGYRDGVRFILPSLLLHARTGRRCAGGGGRGVYGLFLPIGGQRPVHHERQREVIVRQSAWTTNNTQTICIRISLVNIHQVAMSTTHEQTIYITIGVEKRSIPSRVVYNSQNT